MSYDPRAGAMAAGGPPEIGRPVAAPRQDDERAAIRIGSRGRIAPFRDAGSAALGEYCNEAIRLRMRRTLTPGLAALGRPGEHGISVGTRGITI